MRYYTPKGGYNLTLLGTIVSPNRILNDRYIIIGVLYRGYIGVILGIMEKKTETTIVWA